MRDRIACGYGVRDFMTTVLILLAIALIICLVFMGAVFYLLLDLEKNVEKQAGITSSLSEQFKEIRKEIEAVNYESEVLRTLNHDSKESIRKAEVLLESASNTLRGCKESSSLARDTIQEVRRMLKLDPEGTQKLVYENGKPKEIRSLNETFKFEEKEEDEDKPQS